MSYAPRFHIPSSQNGRTGAEKARQHANAPSPHTTLQNLQQTVGNRAISNSLEQQVPVGGPRQIQRALTVLRDPESPPIIDLEGISQWLTSSEVELPDSWEPVLKVMVESGLDIDSITHPGSKYRDPQELADHIFEFSTLGGTPRDIERWLLLKNIRSSFFQTPADQVLYLGAGGDLNNPAIATGSSDYTFVDREAINLEEMLKYAKGVYRGQNITPHHMDYMDFLSQLPTSKKFDVLFDKDSWLGEAQEASPGDETTPSFLATYLGTLTVNGYWVTNYSVPSNILAAMGFQDKTNLLHEVLRNVSFGIQTVHVAQKTEDITGVVLDMALRLEDEFRSFSKMTLREIKALGIDYAEPMWEGLQGKIISSIEMIEQKIQSPQIVDNFKALIRHVTGPIRLTFLEAYPDIETAETPAEPGLETPTGPSTPTSSSGSPPPPPSSSD